MSYWIQQASDWLWGAPMLVLFVGVGVWLIVPLRGIQFRAPLSGLRALKKKDGLQDGDISPFAALMTSIAGIVGNGNIAGVATAVTAGGPGALFWMWISGVIGMGTMFAESILGVRYRKKTGDGLWVGGPMYFMRDRLGWPKIAAFFAFATAAKALLATTTVQSHSIATVVESETGISPFWTCVFVAGVTAAVVLGGVQSIARTSEILSPIMGILYLAGAGAVLAFTWREIPSALALVVHHAFTPMAATGGFLGASVREAFRYGLARGVYSNEAGTGSVPIAHASARSKDPITQGRIAMLGVFLDTLVVCTATGLVLLTTGSWSSGTDSSALAALSFSSVLGPVGGWIVLGASLLFGLSTLFAWAFYGEQCAAYLFGARARLPYRILFSLAIIGGSVSGARAIWAWGDLLNGIAAIPNLIALVLLSRELSRLVKTREVGASAS